MAAALRLGASQVDGVDIDPNSIKAASELLSKFDVGKNWSVHAASLFDLPARTYDIVYSWGVLHHTGAMWRALEHVTTFVRPGGLLAVAIYRRSPACGFWQKEKRLYSSAPPPVRLFIRSLYKAAYHRRRARTRIRRVPASVTSSVLRLPAMMRRAYLATLSSPIVLFVHPWEFVDLRREKLRWDCRFKTGDVALRCVREVLEGYAGRGARFVRMRELA